MTAGPEYSEEDIALAGEYALDLLTAAEREAFERRLTAEPHLRLLVLEWDEGFAPLTDAVAEQDPPALVRARIEARLFGDPPAARRRWFRPWIGAVGGALAAAAVVAVVFFTDPAAPTLPTHRADITATGDTVMRISAAVDAANGTITVTRLAGSARPNRALELWLIVEGDPVPKSLGLLAAGETSDLTLAAEFRDRLQGAVLAVSDEPPGGSPTGAPTGEVLAAGAIAAL